MLSVDDPEPGVLPRGLPIVPVPAAEDSDPAEDPGLVDAGALPPVVVVLELQANVMTGWVVVPWDGVFVVWQTGAVEPGSVETPAVWVAASVAPADD